MMQGFVGSLSEAELCMLEHVLARQIGILIAIYGTVRPQRTFEGTVVAQEQHVIWLDSRGEITWSRFLNPPGEKRASGLPRPRPLTPLEGEFFAAWKRIDQETLVAVVGPQGIVAAYQLTSGSIEGIMDAERRGIAP